MEKVRGVSKETRGIVLRCQEDATSAEERGIDGRSAHIWVEVVIIVGTRVIGRRIVLVGLPRETKVRGPILGVSNNLIMVDQPARLTSSGISVTRERSKFRREDFRVGYII